MYIIDLKLILFISQSQNQCEWWNVTIRKENERRQDKRGTLWIYGYISAT